MFRSFFTVSFFISLSRILGFIRDILIARYVGVSMVSDAFFAAFRVPNFFRRIFAEGAFNSVFVPIFVDKLHDKSCEKDEKFFLQNIFSILLYTLFIFVLLVQIFMSFCMKIIFPGFFSDPEKSSLLVSLSRITIFYLIFISIVSLFSGVLNSLNKFAVPASSPIILNCTLIASIFALGSFVPNYGYALAWGVFLAGVLQFLFITFFVFKNGYFVYLTFPRINSDIKKFFRKLIPGVIGGNVMQINLLFDSIFASMIVGAVSYLYYADRINQLPLAMIGIAINIALLPNLSRKIKENEFKEANNLQNFAIEVGLFLVVPAFIAFVVLSNLIISTLFEGGAFSASETSKVSTALLFYSFGLPSYVLVKIFEPSFFARGDTKTPMEIAFCCLVCNVVLNYLFFIYYFHYVGIILSSVISSYLNLGLIIFFLIKKGYFTFNKDFLDRYWSIIAPSFLMGVFLLLVDYLFLQISFTNKYVILIISIIVGILSYLLGSYISGSYEIVKLDKFFKRKRDESID